MVDKFRREERSRIMSRIKGYDTAPEKIVRSLLHEMGYRFRLHSEKLPGTPDIVLPRHRKVIYVHGCFWHGHKGCPRSKRPTTNINFWNRKIESNIKRDKKVRIQVKTLDWKSLVIWQCQIDSKTLLAKKLRKFLTESRDV